MLTRTRPGSPWVRPAGPPRPSRRPREACFRKALPQRAGEPRPCASGHAQREPGAVGGVPHEDHAGAAGRLHAVIARRSRVGRLAPGAVYGVQVSAALSIIASDSLARYASDRSVSKRSLACATVTGESVVRPSVKSSRLTTQASGVSAMFMAPCSPTCAPFPGRSWTVTFGRAATAARCLSC